MGLSLSQYIPLIIYISGIVVVFLSVTINPAIGIFFLFPVLPYQIIFQKIQKFPFGKDLNDILIIAILLGFFLRRGNTKTHKETKYHSHGTKTELRFPVVILAVVTFIGFINSTLRAGMPLSADNQYLIDWKDYMMLPLIWFLTFRNIRDRKALIFLVTLLLFGILGVDYYFSSNLKWMNLWHYSDRARHMMTGLFVYLGANHYGAFFAHFIFILIGLFLFTKNLTKKIMLLALISLTAHCLTYTFSRGAYLAFLVGIIFIGIVKQRKSLLLIIIFLIFWRSLVPISVRERIEMTKNEDGELEHSAAVRIALWNEAMERFSASPLIGQGFNTFSFEYDGFEWKDTHNFYLKMLAELGILGLLSFLYLLFVSFKTGWKLYKESSDRMFKGLGLGFSACVLSTVVTNAFGDRWSYLCLGSYFWIFLGIVARANLLNKAQIAQQND